MNNRLLISNRIWSLSKVLNATSVQTKRLHDIKNYGFRLTISLASLVLMSLPLKSNADNSGKYLLAAGDVISIRVFREPDLSYSHLRLTDTGIFSYPFLGEINATGFTKEQLEKLITEGLQGDYIVNPKVSVSIVEYREIFVNGYVKKPGGYSFKPGLTVQKAIALAGGFTERAANDNFEIVREEGAEEGTKKESKEKIKAVLQTPVLPGDIITVEQRFF